jgi:hypothetical protein
MREGVRNCSAQFWLAMKVKMNKDGNESSLLLILGRSKKNGGKGVMCGYGLSDLWVE